MSYYKKYETSRRIEVPELKEKLANKYSICWTGTLDRNQILIRLNNGKHDCIVRLDIRGLPTLTNPSKVRHNEATSEPLSFTGITWQRGGWLKPVRYACIYGINTGSRCIPGLKNIPTTIPECCAMGYDIETSQRLTKNGSFPSSRSPITSLALCCSCGYTEAWTTIKHKEDTGSIYVPRSSDVVESCLSAIVEHRPLWLVGYNCYQFDNCVMSYHSPPALTESFRGINSGTKAASRYAVYIDLPGVHNVDLYVYLDKCLRGKYKALSLDAVAKFHNIGGKTTMPTEDTEDTVKQLVDYNMNDSLITSKLWTVTGVSQQIVGLCSASCSPVIDCVRYITGTMASCGVSSHCLSKNMLMDWSECNLRIGYEGGTVLEPDRKIHRKVTVCDFSAMYPTIIMDIGISPENIQLLKDCSGTHDDKILFWNDSCVLACIKKKIIRYNTNASCMTRDVLSVITSTRMQYKTVNPSYANALKVLANSLYGALGYASSPLHSPRCAATVTACGRTALAAAYTTFKHLGLSVVYGDTDSCFLAKGPKTNTHFGGDVELHIDSALKIFHNIMRFTPFPNMRMEKEDEYRAVLPVDKKHYAYIDKSGVLKTKGLSSTRKDRIGVCRDMTSLIAECLLSCDDTEMAREYIGRAIDFCFSAAVEGSLDIYSVSKEVRHEGNTCYRWTDDQGEEQNLPVSRVDTSLCTPYSVEKVLTFLESDINRLCIPAGIGTVRNILSDAAL